MFLAVLSGAVVLLTPGCDEVGGDTFEKPRLVVEGSINSGGYPEVYLTMSAVASDEEASVADNIVRWGVVKISDGEREVILTGGQFSGIFPPYRFYNFEMEGVPGKTYTLSAEYKGEAVTSSVTMPAPTPIASVRTEPVDGNENLRNLILSFVAPADVPAYYHVSVKRSGVDRRFYPAMLGAIAVRQAGVGVEIPVYRARRSLSDEPFVPQFEVGDHVAVMLERVSPEVFDFWRAYDNASLTDGSVFISSAVSLPGNISGGYGVWSAQGSSVVSVKIE